MNYFFTVKWWSETCCLKIARKKYLRVITLKDYMFCWNVTNCMWGLLYTYILYIKLLYSEKGTKFFKISTVDLSYVVTVKSTVEILQNFVAFSEYMNFSIMILIGGPKGVHFRIKTCTRSILILVLTIM